MLPSGFFQPNAELLPPDWKSVAMLSKECVNDHDVKGFHLILLFADPSKKLTGSVKFR